MNLKAIRDLREEGKSIKLDSTATFSERSLGQLIIIACDRLVFLMGENEGLRVKVAGLEGFLDGAGIKYEQRRFPKR